MLMIMQWELYLDKKLKKKIRAIYYASKTFNQAQENYSTTEKEMLAMVTLAMKRRTPSMSQETSYSLDYCRWQKSLYNGNFGLVHFQPCCKNYVPKDNAFCYHKMSFFPIQG